jgi:hypothetical protein
MAASFGLSPESAAQRSVRSLSSNCKLLAPPNSYVIVKMVHVLRALAGQHPVNCLRKRQEVEAERDVPCVIVGNFRDFGPLSAELTPFSPTELWAGSPSVSAVPPPSGANEFVAA